MIKSSKQRKITADYLKNYEQELESIINSTEYNDQIKEYYKNNCMRMIYKLKSEIEEYDSLCAGEFELPREIKLKDLLKNLTKIRISKNISQSELAKRINVKRQQINRYEEHDYQTASLERIEEILKALEVKEEINLINEPKEPTILENEILSNIEKAIIEVRKKYNHSGNIIVYIGINKKKSECHIGLLLSSISESIKPMIKSFKETIEPFFNIHKLKYDCFVGLILNPDEDKLRLKNDIQLKSTLPVRELASCS